LTTYQAKVAKSAVGDLKSLDKKDQKKILKAIDKLQATLDLAAWKSLLTGPDFCD